MTPPIVGERVGKRLRTLSARPLLDLPRGVKRALVLGVDVCLCVITAWLALSLRLESVSLPSGRMCWAVAGALAIALPTFIAFGLYRAVFRFGGWSGLMTIARAAVVYGVLYGAVFTLIGIDGVPRAIGLIQPPLLLLAVCASRAFARHWLGGSARGRSARSALPRVLIYGAGDAGRQLAHAMSQGRAFEVAGFVDDDDRLQHGAIRGLPVHAPGQLSELVRTLRITDIFLAIPSASRQRRNEILGRLRTLHVAVRTLPGLMDLAQGHVQTSDLREFDVEDLLCRDPVPPDAALMAKRITGKVVLVTGAGGSIGSELCRQIVRARPATLLLVERSEYALYTIEAELLMRLQALQGAAVRIVPLLASVGDERRMREIVEAWRPHTLYHAAAYKHVPLVEHNPAEGIRNNVFGTLTAARVAAQHRVSDFVLVSTDKAVRPTNVMGAAKRLAEMALQAMAKEASRIPGGTRFSMVRFGNVLDSSGSVVPAFRRQIKDGGPITLTHLDITRYFMTIPEAAQLVIQAGAMAVGGEVFVLDMGEPLRIADLARRMVALSGMTVCEARNPDGDIRIEVTGLRPGEKLYEELLIGNDPLPTDHPRIMKAHDEFMPWPELSQRLEELAAAMDANDAELVRSMLRRLVPGYRPDGKVVDWVHLERSAVTKKQAARSDAAYRHLVASM